MLAAEVPVGDAGPAAIGGAAADETVVEDLVLEPYACGRLILDKDDDDDWWLTDLETLETVLLPSQFQNPSLIFAAGNVRACIMDEDGAHGITVDEFMKKNVYLAGDRRIMVEKRGDTEVQADFNDYISRYREANVKTPSPNIGDDISLDIAVFVRARGSGCRVYWCLNRFYLVMKLNSYGGQPSQWIKHARPSWEKRLQGSLGVNHLIGSTQTKQDVAFRDRCLPYVGASSMGAIGLLSMWGSRSSRQTGAFDNLASRCVAASLCRSLLKFACEGASADGAFSVFFDEAWSGRWPRPSSSRNCLRARLTMDDDGLVDVASWQLLGSQHGGIAKAAWDDLCIDTYLEPGTSLVPFTKLLDRSALCVTSQWLWAQLVVYIRRRLDMRVLKAALEGDLCFTWVGVDHQTHIYTDVDRQVWQYVESCKRDVLLDDFKAYSFVTDKGDAGSLPLQFSASAFSNNRAYLHVPVASSLAAEVCSRGVPERGGVRAFIL